MNTRIAVAHTESQIRVTFADTSPEDPTVTISKTRDLPIAQALMLASSLINETTALLVEIGRRSKKAAATEAPTEVPSASEGSKEETA